MKATAKRKVLVALYLIIILSTVVCIYKGVFIGVGNGQPGENMKRWGYLKAFTPDSNILCALTALLCLIYLLKNKSMDFPPSLMILNLIGTTAVCVTFVLVTIFLTPVNIMNGGRFSVMYAGDMFHMHFLNPVFAATALILAGRGKSFSKAALWMALSPVFIYSVIYLINVIFLKNWPDFYSFTLGGKMWMVPVSMILMYALSSGITALLVRLCRGKCRRRI